jgi:hypothetical protein
MDNNFSSLDNPILIKHTSAKSSILSGALLRSHYKIQDKFSGFLYGFTKHAADYLVKLMPVHPPEVLVKDAVQLNQVPNAYLSGITSNNAPYAALIVSAAGVIAWLPMSATVWLREFQQPLSESEEAKIGALLPTPLLTWFKAQQCPFINAKDSVFKRDRAGVRFSVKMQPYFQGDNYLFLMEKLPAS